MHQQRHFYLLALNRVGFLKTAEKLYFLDILDNAAHFFSLSRKDIEAAISRKVRLEPGQMSACLKAAEADLRFLEANSRMGFVFFWDRNYPAALREIFDPPFLLFYRGRLPLLQHPVVAIVGTRQPSGSARTAAFQLAMELSGKSIGIVSGLARGIDAEAHAGTLMGDGLSIAVLGNGIDSIYPLSNRELAQSLLTQGGVIFSEYGPGTPPLKYHFPRRNRIISGIARSIVVIQAPEKSGALITAEYGLNQGRDIYVHKAGITGNRGAGTLKLVNDGALLIENSSQILYDWGWITMSYRQESCGRRKSGKKLSQEAGNRLADRLKLELENQYITYNGEFFRRFSEE